MMKKLKILVIPTNYPNDKQPLKGIFFKNQAQALAKHADVAVLDLELLSVKELKNYFKIDKYAYSIEKNVHTFRFREFNYGLKCNSIVNKLYEKHVYKCFEKVITKFGMPDIIHGQVTYYGGYLSYLLSKKYNIPYIVTEHFSFLEKMVEKNPEICKKVFENANTYLAVSNTLQNEVTCLGNIPCSVMPNYIDIDSFSTNNYIKSIKNNGKFNLIHVSLFSDIKNIPMLLKSLHMLIYDDKISNVHLHIIGDGAIRSDIERIINNLNLNDFCTLHGSVANDKLSRYINSCNSLVISSKKETFGVVGIEAMILGLPVISTKCGGPQMYITPSTGILVDNDDSFAMKNGLKELITNYYKFDSEYIKEFVTSNFSEEFITNKLLNLYNNLKNKNH